MVKQADIDHLTDAVLSSFNKDTERLTSFIERNKVEKYGPEILDRFLVISENSLRWMVELLVRDAVGITHNLDLVRTLVQEQGFEEEPDDHRTEQTNRNGYEKRFSQGGPEQTPLTETRPRKGR